MSSQDIAIPMTSRVLDVSTLEADFRRSGLEYLLGIRDEFKLIQHPARFESIEAKAQYFGCPLNKIIKAVYFVHSDTDQIYAFIVPGAGRIDFKYLRDNYSMNLGFNPKKKLRFATEEQLPKNMEEGTCNPFIPVGYSNIAAIIFDSNFIVENDYIGGTDDFAVAMGSDFDSHTLSIHMNYGQAYSILKATFPGLVRRFIIKYESEVLPR